MNKDTTKAYEGLKQTTAYSKVLEKQRISSKTVEELAELLENTDPGKIFYPDVNYTELAQKIMEDAENE